MKADVVDRLRVASPCPANWEQMTGDDRVRYCELCHLNVYNVSELTRREANTLIAETEGRICARFFRRSDGTVITRDCPVGLRAIRRRVLRRTAAVFATVTTICATAIGHSRTRGALSEDSTSRDSLTANVAASAELRGQITDPRGEPLEGAIVTLTNVLTNQRSSIKSDKKGRYHFIVSQFGPYRLKVTLDYFGPYQQDLALHSGDGLRHDISLTPGGLVGVIVIEPVRGKGFDLDGVHVRVNEF